MFAPCAKPLNTRVPVTFRSAFGRAVRALRRPPRFRFTSPASPWRPLATPPRTPRLSESTLPAPAPQASEAFDLAILGSGAAAFSAAIEATQAGHRVLMIERSTIGGTCVNIGCVPSKALLRAAQLRAQVIHNPWHGLELRAEGVELAALVRQKDELVATLRREKYLDLIAEYGWEFRQGEARFLDPETITLDGEPLRARAYLLATGAAPAAPSIPGLAEAGYLTSTTALALEQLPRSLIVLGANAVGLELGQLFAQLGSHVTLVELLDRIAPFEEPEISQALRARLEADGLTVLTGARVTQVERGWRWQAARGHPGGHHPLAGSGGSAGRHWPPAEHCGAQPGSSRDRGRCSRRGSHRCLPAYHQPARLRRGRCDRFPSVRLRGRLPGTAGCAERPRPRWEAAGPLGGPARHFHPSSHCCRWAYGG
ncbi:MAG: hypothetical protein KatS3mg061_0088 [Dehalococcoidia bacterium]|nr:MAG: hypothetical protein KatS3mg061_0088 [Dehalococcoidia bacterium]